MDFKEWLETTQIVGYSLYVTEHGKPYFLVAFEPSDPNLIPKYYDHMLERIRAAFINEPPWKDLGWEIQAFEVEDGKLNQKVLKTGSIKL